MDGHDESLLLAQTVPIPDDDTDSDGDQSINLMSFSTPFEMYPPALPKPESPLQSQSLSPRSNESKPTAGLSNTLSSDSIVEMAIAGQPIVEDALRARAEQAESAAERLLELVEPDDECMQQDIIPASLLVGSNNGYTPNKPKTKPSPIPIPQGPLMAPMTPVNRAAAIMKQAAMFKDSPAHNGHSSLMGVLQDKKHETGWWLKRKTRKFLHTVQI